VISATWRHRIHPEVLPVPPEFFLFVHFFRFRRRHGLRERQCRSFEQQHHYHRSKEAEASPTC
jgi:hypothetical protein